MPHYLIVHLLISVLYCLSSLFKLLFFPLPNLSLSLLRLCYLLSYYYAIIDSRPFLKHHDSSLFSYPFLFRILLSCVLSHCLVDRPLILLAYLNRGLYYRGLFSPSCKRLCHLIPTFLPLLFSFTVFLMLYSCFDGFLLLPELFFLDALIQGFALACREST